MIYNINKELLLENVVLNQISTFFSNIYNTFFGGFKYLTRSDVEELSIFLYDQYYLNNTISNNFLKDKKNKKLIEVFNKIKSNSTKNLPNKLYRGLSFKSLKEYNDFKNSSAKNGLTGKALYSSWSSYKDISQKFCKFELHDNFIPKDHKIGVLLEVSISDYKNAFLFSIEHLLENINEKRDFLKLIFSKEFEKNIKKISKINNFRKVDDRKLIGLSHGTLFSVMEHEYILGKIPFNKIKIVEEYHVK